MNLDRAALLALSLGLFGIVQPWAQALFVIGFPLTLAGAVAYGLAARRAGHGEDGA